MKIALYIYGPCALMSATRWSRERSLATTTPQAAAPHTIVAAALGVALTTLAAAVGAALVRLAIVVIALNQPINKAGQSQVIAGFRFIFLCKNCDKANQKQDTKQAIHRLRL